MAGQARDLADLSPWRPCPVATRQAHHLGPAPADCSCCGGPIEILTDEVPALPRITDWPWAFGCRDCGMSVAMAPRTALPMGSLADAETHSLRSHVRLHMKALYLTGLLSYQDAVSAIAVVLHAHGSQAAVDQLSGHEAHAVCDALEEIYLWEMAMRLRHLYLGAEARPRAGGSLMDFAFSHWPAEDLRLARQQQALLPSPFEAAMESDHLRAALPPALNLEHRIFRARLAEFGQTEDGSIEERRAMDELDDAIETLTEAMFRYRIMDLRERYAPLLPGLGR
jgi:hypothetical protein